MDAERGDAFVGMYVNELTCDFGDEGRQAVRELLQRAGHSTQIQFVE
jgi:predicted solute-binding protein